MNIIDKASVLHGTMAKAFYVAEREMREYYSRETAKVLYDVYKDASLSFILDNFSTIVREVYFGTDFIRHLLNTAIFPPHSYVAVIHKIEDTIREAKANLVSNEQIEKYENLFSIAKDRLRKIQNTAKLTVNCPYDDYLDLFYDVLYDIEKDGSKKELMDFISDLIEIKEPYKFFSIAGMLLSKYPQYAANVICAKTRMFYCPYTKEMDLGLLKTSLQTITALKYLAKDDYIQTALNMSGNINLKNMWYKIMSEDISKIDDKRVSFCNVPFCRSDVVQPVNSADAIDAIFAESSKEDINRDRIDAVKYHNLAQRKVILEHMLERDALFEEYALSDDMYEYYAQEIANTEADMVALEWEDDGEPNAVIKEQIMTRKQKEEAQKGSEKDTPEKEDNEEDDSEDEPKEISKKNKDERKKITVKISKELPKEVKGASVHYSKASLNEFLNGTSNDLCLGSFKKEEYNAVFKAIKEMLDGREFDVVKDNYFTLFLKIPKTSDLYIEASDDFGPIEVCENSIFYEELEDDSDDSLEEEEEAPKKPKEDFATKVQNKALDYDAKRKKKKEERDEKKMKLKNAGKAATEGQRSWFANAKKWTEKVDKMDDNRRKRFLVKPGNRHRIFRNFRLALTYGVTARINIFMVPYLMVLRHFSKEKDKRITNELARELDAEIKICDEKIADASADGDKKEKYKLMRIKDKLTAEKQRVQTNSRMI